MSVNLPVGRIGYVPVGGSFNCSIADGRITSLYGGVGVVAGANATFTPRASAGPQIVSGDPHGFGVRTSLTFPIPGTLTAYGISPFYGTNGSSLSPASVQFGGELSGTATFGYNQRLGDGK